ncbi:hypothetical protein INR49_002058 [Caranx melampygus]|nr:hypothetical protein INR49_002058 [Caranx melampygus]
MTSGVQAESTTYLSRDVSPGGNVEAVREVEVNRSQKYRSAARRRLLVIILSGYLLHEPLSGATTIVLKLAGWWYDN